MMTIRARSVFVLALICAACNGISYPPTTPTSSTAALTPTTINVVPSPPQLPEGGGQATINIEVLAGLSGVAGARVQLLASAGTLSASEITTDSTGHAKVDWQGKTQPTITARVGELAATASIRIPGPAIVNTPGTPAPGPTPPAPTPHPGPSTGELTVRLEMTAAFTGEPVTFNATVSGNGVPFALTGIEWDLTGDGQPDRSGNPVTWTYPAIGDQTVGVSATAADGRRGDAGFRFTVQPADSYAVTLGASPSSANTGEMITLTANVVSRNGVIPAGMQFAWDFNGDGATDATTVSSSTTTSYATAGTRTASVAAVAGDGRRATAGATIAISYPALTATLSATPSSITQGGATTLSATATNLLSGETVTAYEWDATNDGTTDATTSVPTHSATYASAGTFTAKVTLRTSLGRTGSTTTAVTVTGIPALTVSLSANPTTVAVGGTVTLTAVVSNLQSGETIDAYEWDFTNDGTFDATTTTPTRTTPAYTSNGVKTARVRVTSNQGRTAVATVTIVVTN